MSNKIDTKDITAELLQDLDRELNKHISKFNNRLETISSTHVFQERHISGHLWWKKTYYTYFRYFEGSVVTVPKYDKSITNHYESL